jgi:hypothetical protein
MPCVFALSCSALRSESRKQALFRIAPRPKGKGSKKVQKKFKEKSREKKVIFFWKNRKNTYTQNVVEGVSQETGGGFKISEIFSSNLELPIRCRSQKFSSNSHW